jgi:hypothetical protein
MIGLVDVRVAEIKKPAGGAGCRQACDGKLAKIFHDFIDRQIQGLIAHRECFEAVSRIKRDCDLIDGVNHNRTSAHHL